MSNLFLFLKSHFRRTAGGKKIFEEVGNPQPNFKIVATHIRTGKSPKNYMLDDAVKLPLVVEKWRFEPGHAVGRCGYDYHILFTNGEKIIPILVLNWRIVFEDFIFDTSVYVFVFKSIK